MALTTLDIKFENIDTFTEVLGAKDSHLEVLSQFFDTKIYTKGDTIQIECENEATKKALEDTFFVLIQLVNHHIKITERDVIYVAKMIGATDTETLVDHYLNRVEIVKTQSGRPIYAKTINQKRYLEAIEANDLVFAIGPAGTGKTYVAIMHAVRQLKEGRIKKIILTRPAVEAGENLGFLPGDLKEKIDPYLRPLYDALDEALGRKQTDTLIEKGVVEIAPLAYMRGRTLEGAYVVLDEAQNTTKGQMKLFLTRLGFNSKMVVTGDTTQVDLPKNTRSGLIHATELLKGVRGIFVMTFERLDVIRHPLIQKVLERYDDEHH